MNHCMMLQIYVIQSSFILLNYTYIYKRGHCQMKIVAKVFRICLDLAGNLIFFSRISKISEGVDTANLGERHFAQTLTIILDVHRHRISRAALMLINILVAKYS